MKVNTKSTIPWLLFRPGGTAQAFFRRGRAQRASTVLHNPCREDNRIPSLATDARYEVSNAPVFRPDAGHLNSRGDRRERVVSIQRRGTVLEEAGILAERVARRIELGVGLPEE